ncbi:MAG: Glycosyl transferase, group 1 [Ignavibacteriae bacterium]|nr:MAG: Glycosyl transferase, group 1 [Ignavibacteriota bacterium]
MKIIIVGTAYPFRGGIAHFNALLANYLALKHQVEIITFTRQYPKLLFPGKSQIERAASQPDVPIYQMIDSINPLSWYKTANIIKQKQPDLLIFKYWIPFFAPCFGTIAQNSKKNTNTKVLIICDNVIPHEKRIGDKTLTKYFFRQADYFIVQSKSVEKDLINLIPDAKYLLAPHPIYEIFGKKIDKSTARTTLNLNFEQIILFFGYIRKYKGLHILLEAINLIAKKTQPPHLLVAGEFYDDENTYRNYVRQNNLEKYVTFISDYIPIEKVNLYFSAADVVVLPYISATQSGIVQIAYNFDKPVIVTDVGGLSEVVKNNLTGYVVQPENPENLASAIMKFYNENKEPVFTENVIKEKVKYSWQYFISELERLIEVR